MTGLAQACLALLSDEAGMPPLSAESLSRVLWCTGTGTKGRPFTVAELEAALEELMAAGRVEAVYSRRLGRRWRAMRQTQAGGTP